MSADPNVVLQSQSTATRMDHIGNQTILFNRTETEAARPNKHLERSNHHPSSNEPDPRQQQPRPRPDPSECRRHSFDRHAQRMPMMTTRMNCCCCDCCRKAKMTMIPRLLHVAPLPQQSWLRTPSVGRWPAASVCPPRRWELANGLPAAA